MRHFTLHVHEYTCTESCAHVQSHVHMYRVMCIVQSHVYSTESCVLHRVMCTVLSIGDRYTHRISSLFTR